MERRIQIRCSDSKWCPMRGVCVWAEEPSAEAAYVTELPLDRWSRLQGKIGYCTYLRTEVEVKA